MDVVLLARIAVEHENPKIQEQVIAHVNACIHSIHTCTCTHTQYIYIHVYICTQVYILHVYSCIYMYIIHLYTCTHTCI